MKSKVTCLFLDIGGVPLTNGWDHHACRRAARRFELERAEMEARYLLISETYETGGITLAEYLDRVVFHRKRPFPPATFRKFMFTQSQALPGMIEMMVRLKARHALKIAVVSNEGRGLNGILHTHPASRERALRSFGLSVPEGLAAGKPS